MNGTKFTPGSWIAGSSSLGYPTVKIGKRLNVSVGGYSIRELKSAEADRFIQEVIADTHLVAAAPDLYAALEQLVEHMPKQGDAAAFFRYAKAMSALAKARGENAEAQS